MNHRLPLSWLPGAFRAAVTWPLFSLTSYRIATSLARQGNHPLSVIDVGANVGQFAVAAAKVWPGASVYSFEPIPECHKQLVRNCRSLANVVSFNIALGHVEGDAELHVNAHSHSSSLLRIGEHHMESFPYAKEVRRILVTRRTLDSVFADVHLRKPVLLKLDVQGSEIEVIRGGGRMLDLVDQVLMEISFRPLYQGELPFLEVVAEMAKHGFEFLRPIDWFGNVLTGEILQIDALFARRRTGN